MNLPPYPLGKSRPGASSGEVQLGKSTFHLPWVGKILWIQADVAPERTLISFENYFHYVTKFEALRLYK